MQVKADGSVELSRGEVAAVAEALDLGYQLIEQMGVNEMGAAEYTVEARLFRQLEKLRSLGLSIDTLKDVVDARFRNA